MGLQGVREKKGKREVVNKNPRVLVAGGFCWSGLSALIIAPWGTGFPAGEDPATGCSKTARMFTRLENGTNRRDKRNSPMAGRFMQ